MNVWKVSEVAERAHVSVRTLHHYDEIGLLVPASRTPAGYRLYSDADLERLYRILLFRELGMPLAAIRRAIDAPTADARAELIAHRALLAERRRRTDAVLRAVDRALDHMEKGTAMTRDELNEGFDAFANAPESIRRHQAEHAAEVSERWGGTEPHAESMKRARSYGPKEWESIRAEGEEAEGRMAELLAAGADPGGEEARAAAAAMRDHISRWFYPCSPEMHAQLADMYEADPRFRAHYEKRAEGLASFVAAAIRASAR